MSIRYPDYSEISTASNFRLGDNPAYTISDFISVYPQFGSYEEPEGGGDAVWIGPIPENLLQMYINVSSASLNIGRWKELWQMGMGLCTAHFATLYLLSLVPGNATASQIAQAGIARGIQISKSVGPVSVSHQSIVSDINGFAAWKLTMFGQQLITHARIVGMGGSVIW